MNLKSSVITIPEHTRKQKRTHEELFKGLPSRDEIISLPEAERVCDTCSATLEVIGTGLEAARCCVYPCNTCKLDYLLCQSLL